ncbi:MAG: phosphatase PAP2 family protein [Porphyromonadaceae bacterium]|nr:phosphatase PAP2 family protein [Porphyromonadaceae bacterium]
MTGRRLLLGAGSMWLALTSLGASEHLAGTAISRPRPEALVESAGVWSRSSQVYGGSIQRDSTHLHPLLKSMGRALPALAIGIGYNLYNQEVRRLRMAHVPSFRNRYDDYMQFAPLAAQLGMRLWGIEGSSHSLGQMVLADAIASASMLAIVYTTKTATAILRPDGSSYNSFPSGHTAMAFTSATLLHQEYGARYPWLSVLSYTAASASGIGRVLNNRHWIGDVVTGAALGYVCGKLGYWLSDIVYGRERDYSFLGDRLIEGTELGLYMPVRYGYTTDHLSELGLSIRHRTTQIGLGARWGYSQKGYFAEAELSAEVHDLSPGQAKEEQTIGLQARALNLRMGWGRALELVRRRLFVDASGFVVLKMPESVSPSEAYKLENQRSLSVGVSIAPRWQFTGRLSLGVHGSYEYAPKNWRVVAGNRHDQLTMPQWYLGSTLSILI